MPGFNQTGPSGQGPKTGRQQGQCGNKDTTDSHLRRFKRRLHLDQDDTPMETARGMRARKGGMGRHGKGQQNSNNN